MPAPAWGVCEAEGYAGERGCFIEIDRPNHLRFHRSSLQLLLANLVICDFCLIVVLLVDRIENPCVSVPVFEIESTQP